MSAQSPTKGFLMSASTIVLAALGVRGCVIREAALPCVVERFTIRALPCVSASARQRSLRLRTGSTIGKEQGSVRALANFDALSDYSSSL